MANTTQDLDQLCIDTIRTLSIDAVQKANSGHPGAPMAMAPAAYTLFDRVLRYNPADPAWANRDRFVLSMGHASALLYSTFHLAGFDVTLDDLRAFRQLGGRCAGHPEFGLVPGVETTTGPLGQGAGNSVGMAIAGKWLAKYFNRPGHELFDYRVWAMCSDGDLMEGVASEAASLAGHLALDNLIWVYDSNSITIDGSTSLCFSEDVGQRFEAYGWHVERVEDVNDLPSLTASLQNAVTAAGRPALVIVRSHIGYGSPNKQDSAGAHGAPLGEDEVRATKQAYGWDPEREFYVPDAVLDHMRDGARRRGETLQAEWQRRFEAYAREHPALADQWRMMQTRDLPDGWADALPEFEPSEKGKATRKSAGETLAAIAAQVPWLFGGSADLAASNNTLVGDKSAFGPGDHAGRNLYFGIREHAMAAVANGMALCGMRPYTATFLVFSDYMRPSIRLAAMMGQPVLFVFTHDSIGVGEDGPTHQPIEQVSALRLIPGLDVVRPADANEAKAAWTLAMRTTDRPVALILTRQSLPTLDRSRVAPAEGLLRGGYVLADCDGSPDLVLIGTGSEVQLCLAAREQLAAAGVAVRVVSMPCRELFDRQEQSYRDEVLPAETSARLAVEAGVSSGWREYVGPLGAVVSCDDFGTSAPGGQAMIEYGMTVENVVASARQVLERSGG